MITTYTYDRDDILHILKDRCEAAITDAQRLGQLDKYGKLRMVIVGVPDDFSVTVTIRQV